jgi:hypothetical protein
MVEVVRIKLELMDVALKWCGISISAGPNKGTTSLNVHSQPEQESMLVDIIDWFLEY